MRYPKFLPVNGTIGFVAPSFGCATEPYYTAFLNAQKKFQKMGYGLDLGPNCYVAEGIGISNTPQACGKELTDYYCSVDNDILISCGGGEMMCETMNFVDFEKIKSAEPKWYMGYSDNTNFTFLLSTICDTAAVYGPCAGTFGMEPWHESLFDTMEVLTGKRTKLHSYPFWEKDDLKDEGNPYVPYNTTEPLNLVLYTGAENPDAVVTMEGRLVGGCVDCLVNLLGTQFDYVNQFNEKYKEDGIIWFLECCDLNVMGIRRAMWQMKNAGWFQHVKGFLIGRPCCIGEEMMGLDHYHAVTDILKDFEVPIIMDMDIGHRPPMMPLVCGSMAAVYGPCAGTFGMEPWHESLFDTMEVLTGKRTKLHSYPFWEKDDLKDEGNPYVPYNTTEPLNLVLYTGAENPDAVVTMEGRLVGGCVDCLVNLLGTQFDYVNQFNEKYKEDGIIWFLECCDLNVMGIRRAMWQMKNAGWFQHVKGFLIGRPCCIGEEMMGLDHYHAVTDILKDFEVPIIMDMDIGHRPPMMPLVCGSMAEVCVKGNDVTIDMKYI